MATLHQEFKMREAILLIMYIYIVIHAGVDIVFNRHLRGTFASYYNSPNAVNFSSSLKLCTVFFCYLINMYDGIGMNIETASCFVANIGTSPLFILSTHSIVVDNASDCWRSVLALCVVLPVQSSDEAAAVLWRVSWSPRRTHQRRMLG